MRTDRVRVDADQETAIARLLQIYANAIGTPTGLTDPSRAAAVHCSRIAVALKQTYRLNEQVARLESELEVARQAERHVAGGRALQARIDGLVAELEHLGARNRDALAQHARDTRALDDRITVLRADHAQRQVGAQNTAHQLASALQQLEVLQDQIAAFRRLPTLRLRDAVLRTPLLGAAIQRIARRLAPDG